jgi:hypothetical protein
MPVKCFVTSESWRVLIATQVVVLEIVNVPMIGWLNGQRSSGNPGPY